MLGEKPPCNLTGREGMSFREGSFWAKMRKGIYRVITMNTEWRTGILEFVGKWPFKNDNICTWIGKLKDLICFKWILQTMEKIIYPDNERIF